MLCCCLTGAVSTVPCPDDPPSLSGRISGDMREIEALHTPFGYQLLGQLGLDRYPRIKVFQTGLRFGFISLSRK